MELYNETGYPTRKLRALICAVHAELAKTEKRRLPTWNKLRVWVVYSAKFGGAATYDGTWMVMKLQTGGHSTARIAKLIDHELRHSYGYTHRQMPAYLKTSATTWAWAERRFGIVIGDGARPGCQLAHRLRDMLDTLSEGPTVLSSRLLALASAQGGRRWETSR